MKILKLNHISLDIETFSTHQNAVIVQIGACKFNFNDGIASKFLVNIDPNSGVKHGLHIEKSTVAWWLKQDKAVIASLRDNPQPLPDALIQLNNWIGLDNRQLIWSNGCVFDMGILRSNYEKCGIQRNWPYYNEMDFRTVSTLLDIKLSKGNTHNALEDAVNQAEQFIKLFDNVEVF